MTGIDDDRELDDFLARRSALHRRLADRDRVEPSSELDRLVLGKAREAIETPANLPVHRAPRWAMPVALAATVVLAFAIVLNMGRVDRGSGYPVSASAQAVADTAVVAETREEPLAAAPPALPIDRQREQQEVLTARTSARSADSDLIAPPRAPEGLPSKTRSVARKAAPEVDMPQAVAQVSSEEEAPVTLTARSAPSAAAPLATDAVSAGAIAGHATPLGDARTAAKAEVAASNAAPATPPPPAAEPISEAKRSTPQAWLKEIDALRKAGKSADADRELAEFRKRYPNEPTEVR